MQKIILMVLPVVIQFISWLLSKQKNNEEAKRAFLAFVEKMQEHSGNSVNLRSSYKAQIERLRAQNVKPNHNASK